MCPLQQRSHPCESICFSEPICGLNSCPRGSLRFQTHSRNRRKRVPRSRRAGPRARGRTPGTRHDIGPEAAHGLWRDAAQGHGEPHKRRERGWCMRRTAPSLPVRHFRSTLTSCLISCVCRGPSLGPVFVSPTPSTMCELCECLRGSLVELDHPEILQVPPGLECERPGSQGGFLGWWVD